MQDLTLVGVHDDGEHLVLTDAAGQKFRVRLDDSLRAAARRDRPRPGQLHIDGEGLRPREIQARIRSGQTAEEVAEAAGVPVEHVRRFEGPVLAEREFVATQARGVRLRRSGSTITSYTLGELVQQRLGQREVDDNDTSWDAWREDDGTWVVCLSFHAGSTQRRAHWTYDTQLRHVSARNDEARWFTEEERTEITATGQRRLTPIRDTRDAVPSREPGRDQSRDQSRLPAREADDARAGEARTETRAAEGRYVEEYPQEYLHPERYENTRYGEDRFREDPYRDEVYGEDRPAEVRRATIDLLDTLRERRGRRQHLTPADPSTPPPSDAVDAAVETLRTRADAVGDGTGTGARANRQRDGAGDRDLLQLPDDVIELPDDDEPVRRRTSPAAAGAGVAGVAGVAGAAGAAGAPGADRSGTGERLRTAERAISPTHPATTGRRAPQRTAERTADRPARTTDRPERTADRPERTADQPERTADRPERATPPAARTTPPRSGARTTVPAAGAPSAGAGSPGPGRGGGRKAPIGGYPSPAAPPAAPPAPARERQVTGPVVEDPVSGERTTASNRRNKRASVPSWDDIVFGSRRE